MQGADRNGQYREFQIGQHRTSIEEFQIAVGSAVLQPGNSRAEWAMPDLIRKIPERSRRHRTSSVRKKMPEDMSERISEGMSASLSEKSVRKEYQKIYQKKCQ